MEASEKAVCGCSNPLRAKLVKTRSYADLPHLSMSSSWLQGLLRPGQAWQRYFPQCERVIVHHIPMVGACIRKQQRTREHSQGEHCTPTTPTPFSVQPGSVIAVPSLKDSSIAGSIICMQGATPSLGYGLVSRASARLAHAHNRTPYLHSSPSGAPILGQQVPGFLKLRQLEPAPPNPCCAC